MALGDLVIKLGMNSQSFNRGLTKSRGQLGTFGASVGSIAKRMVGFGLATVGIGSAVGALTFGVKLAAQAETSQIAFKTLLGSATEAKDMLKNIEQFSNQTPFQFDQLTETARRMMALGTASTDVMGRLRTIGDTAAAMGDTTGATMNRISLALGQMTAKSKVSAQEMNQLAEVGIPAWQLLANKIGVGIPEAMKMAEKGAISASIAVPALLEGMTAKFGGAMNELAKTTAGKWSNMIGEMKFALRDLGTEFLKAFDAKDNIDGMRASIKLGGKAAGDMARFMGMIPVTLKKMQLEAQITFAQLMGHQERAIIIQSKLNNLFGDKFAGKGAGSLSAREATQDQASGARGAEIRRLGPLQLTNLPDFAKRALGSEAYFAQLFGGAADFKSLPKGTDAKRLISDFGGRDFNTSRLAGVISGDERTNIKAGQARLKNALTESPTKGGRGRAGFAEFGTAKAFSAIQASLKGARDPQVEETKKVKQAVEHQTDVLDDIRDALLELDPGVLVS